LKKSAFGPKILTSHLHTFSNSLSLSSLSPLCHPFVLLKNLSEKFKKTQRREKFISLNSLSLSLSLCFISSSSSSSSSSQQNAALNTEKERE
jgi:hypothetical protein